MPEFIAKEIFKTAYKFFLFIYSSNVFFKKMLIRENFVILSILALASKGQLTKWVRTFPPFTKLVIPGFNKLQNLNCLKQ